MNINAFWKVKGESGLWEMVVRVNKNRFIVLKSIGTGKQKTFPAGVCTQLESYEIVRIEKRTAKQDGKKKDLEYEQKLSVEDVLSQIYEVNEDLEDGSKICYDNWKDWDESTQMKVMQEVVPDYDPDQFKSHHMRELIKWYDVLLVRIEAFDVQEKKLQEEAEKRVIKEKKDAKAAAKTKSKGKGKKSQRKKMEVKGKGKSK